MEIYAKDLGLEGEQLATINEYMTADRCVGSLFEGLNPGQKIFLAEGVFVLDEDLDPVLLVEYSWFLGYEDGIEEYLVPGYGRMDSYQIRAKGWKFWSDLY